MTEMKKLEKILTENGVPFVVTIQQWFNTPQIFYPNVENSICDVICHRMSYGGNVGLLEIMGADIVCNGSDDEYADEVMGYLTAEQVAEMIIKHYNQ